MSSWLQIDKEGAFIHLKVTAHAKETKIMGLHGNRLKMRVHAKPIDGAANVEVLRFWQKLLEVKSSEIEIKSGHFHSHKSLIVRNYNRSKILLKVEKELDKDQ